MERKETNKKEYRGTVVSNKMTGTVKVEVAVPMRHPIYKKIVRTTKTYLAATNQEFEIGDEVTIVESRPLSKNVKWVVKENDTEGK